VVRGFSPLVIEGRLDGLAGFPADGFVGFGVGAGILGAEIREEFFYILETASIPVRVVFPHSRREFGGETTDEVRMLPEAEETASSMGIDPGEVEEDAGCLGDRWGRVGGEGLESGLVLGRDVGLVEHPAEFFQEVDLLVDIAREAGAFLADAGPTPLATEALVGADPLADVAEVTHRRGGDSGFQIPV
jgi:hypothetical protein